MKFAKNYQTILRNIKHYYNLSNFIIVRHLNRTFDGSKARAMLNRVFGNEDTLHVMCVFITSTFHSISAETDSETVNSAH